MNNTTFYQIGTPIAWRIAQENYWLEADGMSSVILYYLHRAGLKEAYQLTGEVEVAGSYSMTHDWIRMGTWTVDFRLRAWYPNRPNEQIPNGIFLAGDYPDIRYHSGKPVPIRPIDQIRSLQRPRPTPDWALLSSILEKKYQGTMTQEDLERYQKELERCPASIIIKEKPKEGNGNGEGP